MMRTMQDALDKVADALWWARGFAAARDGDTVSPVLADQLRGVHEYLRKVQHGEVRRLGEETAVVMTFPEFERLIDAVRVPEPREIKAAAETVEAVLAAYRREEQRNRRDRNSDIPF